MKKACVECEHLNEEENSILLLTKKNGLTELTRFYGINGNVKRSPIGNGKILKCERKGLLHRNHNIYKTRKCGDFSNRRKRANIATKVRMS